jgi:hypothetical protein
MPRGASPKRESEYEELKHEFKKEGRYKGREEEVAARIVNKQRAELGETKESRKKDREGKSPDRHLPLKDYDRLTVKEVIKRIESLSQKEIKSILNYEKNNRKRKTLLERLERKV